MNSCESCIFWSDLVAEKIGNGPLMAWCECPDGPLEGLMTDARSLCTPYAVIARNEETR